MSLVCTWCSLSLSLLKFGHFHLKHISVSRQCLSKLKVELGLPGHTPSLWCVQVKLLKKKKKKEERSGWGPEAQCGKSKLFFRCTACFSCSPILLQRTFFLIMPQPLQGTVGHGYLPWIPNTDLGFTTGTFEVKVTVWGSTHFSEGRGRNVQTYDFFLS